MQKFKRGQMVEIIKSVLGKSVGDRFIVTEVKMSLWNADDLDGVLGYNTGKQTNKGNGKYFFAPETWLKLVKPDSDELSEFSFSELMSNIKYNELVKECK